MIITKDWNIYSRVGGNKMSKLNKYFPNFAKLPDDLRKLNNVHWNNHRTRGYTQVANVNITDTMKDAMDEAVAIGMFNTRSEFVRHAILELFIKLKRDEK